MLHIQCWVAWVTEMSAPSTLDPLRTYATLYLFTSSSSFSVFIAEGRRPRNDAQVLSCCSCLLLLSHTPPASYQSSLIYHLPIVSLAFLCLLRHLDDLQKYVCRGSVLWSCTQSTFYVLHLYWHPSATWLWVCCPLHCFRLGDGPGAKRKRVLTHIISLYHIYASCFLPWCEASSAKCSLLRYHLPSIRWWWYRQFVKPTDSIFYPNNATHLPLAQSAVLPHNVEITGCCDVTWPTRPACLVAKGSVRYTAWPWTGSVTTSTSLTFLCAAFSPVRCVRVAASPFTTTSFTLDHSQSTPITGNLVASPALSEVWFGITRMAPFTFYLRQGE